MFIACLQNNIAVADVIINKLTVNVVLFFSDQLFISYHPSPKRSVYCSFVNKNMDR